MFSILFAGKKIVNVKKSPFENGNQIFSPISICGTCIYIIHDRMQYRDEKKAAILIYMYTSQKKFNIEQKKGKKLVQKKSFFFFSPDSCNFFISILSVQRIRILCEIFEGSELSDCLTHARI